MVGNMQVPATSKIAEHEPFIVNSYVAKELTVSALANRFDVSTTTIKHILRRHHVMPRPPVSVPQATEFEFRSQVVALRQAGLRFRDIARRVKTTTQRVSEVLQAEGLHRYYRRGEESTARRKISPEQEPELVVAYKEGASLATLSLKYECNAVVVRKALLRCGVSMRRRGGAITPFTRDPLFQDKVRTLWDQNLSQVLIAKTLGCSQVVVSSVLIRQGIRSRLPERHGSWKGGRITSPEGYTHVLMAPDHTYAVMRTTNGYVLEHRLVMAEYLGRPLLSHETVHHIDGDKANNTIENLQLRIGQHGSHIVYRCADCGSARLSPTQIAEATEEVILCLS